MLAVRVKDVYIHNLAIAEKELYSDAFVPALVPTRLLTLKKKNDIYRRVCLLGV